MNTQYGNIQYIFSLGFIYCYPNAFGYKKMLPPASFLQSILNVFPII